MKKAVKVSLILGSIFCLIGIGMITAGAMMGGAVELEYSPLWTRMYGEYHDIASEYMEVDADNWRETFSGATAMQLEVGANSTVELIEEWREDQNQDIIVVHEGGGLEYQCKLEGTQLQIQLPDSWHPVSPGRHVESITILVPEGYRFGDVEVEVMAGDFTAQTLHTEKLDLDVGTGAAFISGGEVGALDADCAGGSVSCYAPISTSASVDCAEGNVELQLLGSYENYDYNLDCVVGSITLDGVDAGMNGVLPKEMRMDYHTGRKIDLDCVAGAITVYFQEQGL